MMNSKISLTTLRNKLIHQLYYFLIGVAFLLVILRFIQGESLFAAVNLVLLIGGLISFYFFRSKPQLLLDIIVFSLLGVTIFLSNNESVVSSTIYLSLFPAIATLLYNIRWKRYLVCILSISIFSYIFRDQIQDKYSYYFLTLIGFFIALKFSELLESQQGELIEALEVKEKLTNELSSKNKELITFSHIMSHDLKSPLRTIRSFSQLIRKQTTFENEKLEQYFEFIEDSSKSMSTMIDDLLMYHKVDMQNDLNDKVDLNQVIDTIKSTYQFDLSSNILNLSIESLPTIDGDRNLIRTVFQNLMTNSIKYQPKDQPNHIPTIKISTESTANKIFILIADNGIGIKEDYLDKLFDPFTRFHSNKEYKGSGLGMSICKRVMLRHGGDIELVESSDKGTTFRLSFPKRA